MREPNKNKLTPALARTAKAGVIAVALGACIAGGAIAYFSGSAGKVANGYNVIAGAKDQMGAVSVVEAEWDALKEADENYGLSLKPNDVITKDPAVLSNCEYPAWVFLEVTIPKLEGKLSGNTGIHDMINFSYDSENWSYCAIREDDDAYVYYFAYKNLMHDGDVTTPLFTEMVVPNFQIVQGNANTGAGVDIEAYAISKGNYQDGRSAFFAYGIPYDNYADARKTSVDWH